MGRLMVVLSLQRQSKIPKVLFIGHCYVWKKKVEKADTFIPSKFLLQLNSESAELRRIV